MELCSVDWTSVAAWVQAVGSIGAIAAAIWIGHQQHKQGIALVQEQHRQNIELVEHEQKRLREEAEREAIEEGRDLKELVMIVLDPLMRHAEERIEELNLHNGRLEPLTDEMMQHVHNTYVEAEATKKQLIELRDVFSRRPRHLLVHGHLVGALSMVASACHQEKHYDELRRLRQSKLTQKLFNGPHVPDVAEQPYSNEDLIKAINNLRSVFITVGE